jgi:hypothetical protein
MATQARRWALLLLALATLAVSLLACQAPGGGASQGNAGDIVISTPAGAPSATPTAPPFTIGAWPSNTTPNAHDKITIYVICMVQDPTTGGPSKPAVGLRVQVNVHPPINRSYVATTSGDGMAKIRVTFSDPHPGQPVAVDVATTWQGVTYRRQTFFTPGPQAKPSPTSGDKGGTPGPGGAPPTPTPTPGPNPTATPLPEPTGTTGP